MYERREFELDSMDFRVVSQHQNKMRGSPWNMCEHLHYEKLENRIIHPKVDVSIQSKLTLT